MPRFGKVSLARLKTCHIDLQVIASEVILHYDFAVIYGKRGRSAQAHCYQNGFSRVNWPKGKHNCPKIPAKFANMTPSLWPAESFDWEEDPARLSNAIDLAPWPVDWGNRGSRKQRELAKWRFVQLSGYMLHATAQLLEAGSISHRLRWGGDWDGDHDLNDQSFYDLAHYELVQPERGRSSAGDSTRSERPGDE